MAPRSTSGSAPAAQGLGMVLGPPTNVRLVLVHASLNACSL